MKLYAPENVRTVALVGHGGCGKTTTCETILHFAKATERLGNIESGTTVSDYLPEEKERLISIAASSLHFERDGNLFFLLDTPGYADFFGEVVCCLRACDAAVLVVDAASGIEVGTAKVWGILKEQAIPYAIFVSKLDKENTDFLAVASNLAQVFGPECVPVLLPIGKESSFSGVASLLDGNGMDSLEGEVKDRATSFKDRVVEVATEGNDALLEKYLEGQELSQAEICEGLKAAVKERRLVPVLCGSAQKQLGIREMVQALEVLLPSPANRGPVASEDGQQQRLPDANAPLSALVFKTVTDPYVGQLTYFRIFSGTLRTNGEVFNASKKQKEKCAHVYVLQGETQTEVEAAGPGYVAAVAKLKSTSVGDSLSSPSEPILFRGIAVPKPVVSMAVHPKARGDEEKVSTGLAKLAEEDPTFRVIRNAETKELVVEGMGDVHLDVMMSRLKNKFKVEVDLFTPKVAYKETVTAVGEGHEKHKKQTGGRGQYGEVFLRVEPKGRGEGYEFANELKGGVIPTNFVPAVEKGINAALEEGVLAGYPVVDVRAAVYFGSFHPVDSSEIAFKIAASKAFKDGMSKARPVLLEPIMNVTVTVLPEFMGDITGDLNGKRGRILGMDQMGNMQIIRAQVPQGEMFKYSSELRSRTGGRGSFEMEFSHYEEVPAQTAQRIIQDAKKKPDEQ
ncbi:MAG: elongation factor G [bacterium]|nr:elongation factor G [bacterium]